MLEESGIILEKPKPQQYMQKHQNEQPIIEEPANEDLSQSTIVRQRKLDELMCD